MALLVVFAFPARRTRSSSSLLFLSVVNMRRKAVDLRLGEALRNDVAHDVAQPQQRLVVQVCRPSVGEGNEAPGRQLADEEARRRVRRGRTRAPELKLRIRRLARVALSPGRPGRRGISGRRRIRVLSRRS